MLSDGRVEARPVKRMAGHKPGCRKPGDAFKGACVMLREGLQLGFSVFVLVVCWGGVITQLLVNHFGW